MLRSVSWSAPARPASAGSRRSPCGAPGGAAGSGVPCGLGRALLFHSFRELRRLGRTAVGLSVDSENPTGAVRLYESVGMRPVSRRVLYEKQLSGASAL